MAEEIKDNDMENEKAQADIEAASAVETAETGSKLLCSTLQIR